MKKWLKKRQAKRFIKYGGCCGLKYTPCERCFFKKECYDYKSNSPNISSVRIANEYLKESNK